MKTAIRSLAFISLLFVVAATAARIGSEADDSDPKYLVLGADAEALRSRFNDDLGKTRVVMLVSPTCGGCLRGADQVQKKVLAKIDSPDLAAYAVWVPANGGRERHLPRVLDLVTDARATQYWDDSDVVEEWYRVMLEFDGPCAGVFMVYGPEARWDGESPPEPDYWEDAHTDLRAVYLAPQLNARRLAEVVRKQLQRASD